MARELWLLNDGRIFGGGQLTTLRLATFVHSTLSDQRAQVLCPGPSELAERCRQAGIPVVDARFPDLGLLEVGRIARAVRGLRRLFAEADSDVVVVGTSLRAQVYAHAAAVRLPRPPSIVHLMVEQDSARHASARFLLRRFGSVVVIEENAATAYRERLPGVRVISVNNILLPEEFDRAARARIRRRLDTPALGVLARLIPEKGVLELIHDLAEMPRAWSQLLIAGPWQDPAYAERIEARIAALGLVPRVRLLGPVTDLAAFFAGIDVLIVPSVGNEGQPAVIIEALAHGRPVIVRAPLLSDAFAGFPVLPFRNSADLGRALSDLPRGVPDPQELALRFGPMQLVEAIDAAA